MLIRFKEQRRFLVVSNGRVARIDSKSVRGLSETEFNLCVGSVAQIS